jgi:hypothetical protein
LHPACSPDFSPIELVWHNLKKIIQDHPHIPSSIDELKLAVKKVWCGSAGHATYKTSIATLPHMVTHVVLPSCSLLLSALSLHFASLPSDLGTNLSYRSIYVIVGNYSGPAKQHIGQSHLDDLQCLCIIKLQAKIFYNNNKCNRMMKVMARTSCIACTHCHAPLVFVSISISLDLSFLCMYISLFTFPFVWQHLQLHRKSRHGN